MKAIPTDLLTLVLLSTAILALSSDGKPAAAADWYWSGGCGGDWHHTCQDNPPQQCHPEPRFRTYNNWGQEVCGVNTAFPGSLDTVYLLADHVNLMNASTSLLYLSVDSASTFAIGANRTATIAGPQLANSGTITVNYQPSAWPTALAFAGDATLDGGGEVVLNAISGNAHAQVNTGTEATLTHAAGHTIRGVGQINASMTNDGTVNADRNARELELTTNDKTNNATMMATGGGILSIGDMTVTQGAGGVITANAGTVRLEDGAAIVGGTLSTVSGGVTRTAYLSTSTLTDVLTQGQFEVEARSTARVTGSTLTNDGTITVNYQPIAWPTDLMFDGDVTLEGTGAVVLNAISGNGHAQVNTGDGFTLTHAAGHTIRGVGQINASIINDGTINADRSDRELELTTRDKTNNATMMASDGGILWIEGVTVAQGPGGRIIADAGTVRLNNGAAIVGGTLSTPNAGVVRTTYLTTATLADVVNQGQFDVEARSTASVTGSALTNDGTITVNYQPSGWPTYLTFNSDAALDGSGEVVLNAISGTSHAQLNTGAGSTVTHAANHTIRGTGQINASMINEGIVNADNVNGWNLELLTYDKTNNATMMATGSGVLLLNGMTVTQGPDGEIVADAGTVRLENGAAIAGGSLSTFNGGDVRTAYLSTTTLTDVQNLGQFDIGARSTTRVTGVTLTNDGTITVNYQPTGWPTSLAFDSNVTLDGTGEVVLNRANGHAQLNTGAGVTLTHAAGHTIRGRGQINADMDNAGTVIADAPQDLALNPQVAGITNNGTFEAVAGSTLVLNSASLFTQLGGRTVVDGTFHVNGAPLDLQGGVLKGHGTVNGSVVSAGAIVHPGGANVEPGGSVGTLTVSGSYAQRSGGALEIEVGGTSPGEFDLLSIGGEANLAGQLVVATDGFDPQADQQFVILTAAGGVSGRFDSVDAPNGFDAVYGATTVTLAVPAVPGDIDGDGDVDLQDYINFADCLNGPDAPPAPILPGVTPQECLDAFDFDTDADVDARDLAGFQAAFSG